MLKAPTINSYVKRDPVLTKAEFEWIKTYLHNQSGILLNESKQAMVMGRLGKRLRHYGLTRYQDYFQLLVKPDNNDEAYKAVDLLTTNETYFFREPKHFDFIKENVILQCPSTRSLKIWSAASSSGEEAYTLAMLLAEYARTKQWEILGTDISTEVLAKARQGIYPISAIEKIPLSLLKKYCLKGVDEYTGVFMIHPELRSRIKFLQINLLGKLPDLGMFDVIFLRNVLIYFDQSTKHKLVTALQSYLRPGGYFITSHSESLTGMNTELTMISPSIYRKAGEMLF